MKYFVSAGEASGDLHASKLIEELGKIDHDASFAFLGGDFMAAASGQAPKIHYRDMAYMGFSEVIRHIPEIFANLKKAKRLISENQPDALILVDYPDFNLKLAKFAKSKKIPVYYYISPKIWAWKTYRVREIRRNVRKMLSILPFEPEFYASHGYDAAFVGNPSVEEIDRYLSKTLPRNEFLACHKLDSRPIIALVPGSRLGEIRNNLLIMAEVAARHPEYQAVVAGAPGIDMSFYSRMTHLPVVFGDTFGLMRYSVASLVTSGTATLECALLGTPQVVCYRANGSRLAYNIMKRILKIPFVSLPNLIAGKRIIPEMLVHMCTPDMVDAELTDILPGGSGRRRQLDGYELMRHNLGNNNAAATTAKMIFADLRTLKTKLR